jgi:hypothetical protein
LATDHARILSAETLRDVHFKEAPGTPHKNDMITFLLGSNILKTNIMTSL